MASLCAWEVTWRSLRPLGAGKTAAAGDLSWLLYKALSTTPETISKLPPCCLGEIFELVGGFGKPESGFFTGADGTGFRGASREGGCLDARALARPPVKSMSTSLSFVVLAALPAAGLLLDVRGVVCDVLAFSPPRAPPFWKDRSGFSAPFDPPRRACSSAAVVVGLPWPGLLILLVSTPPCEVGDSWSPSSLELSDTSLPLRWTNFPPLTFAEWLPLLPPLAFLSGARNPVSVTTSSSGAVNKDSLILT